VYEYIIVVFLINFMPYTFKSSDIWVYRCIWCIGIRVYGCTGVLCTGVRVYGCTGVRVYRCNW
jgi:hypothetical protein